ncbi:MAG TPA: ATP-binding cassette domain-containing protein [Acidobacteriaceae bacterium]
MSAPPALLRVRLQAGYRGVPVLEDVAFDLARGEALGVIGSSGAGKSTLILALLGLLAWRGGFASGEVLFEGANLLTLSEREARRLRGRRFAFVPQSPLSALNSALSLQAHFEQAWRAHESFDRARCHARVRELFDQVKLPSDPRFLSRRPGEISVGQAQRVLLALALLHRPTLLIADGPTSALDPVTQTEVVLLLRQLHREQGTTLLYISHDLVSVLQLCDRVAVLAGGRIAECLSVDGIDQTAQHAMTRALLGALPVPAGVLRAYKDRDLQPAPPPRALVNS